MIVVLLVVSPWSDDGPAPPTRIAFVAQELVDLRLDRQVREETRYWSLYEDRDAPEGAYMGWMLPGAESLSARVPLGRTIEPGKYYAFVKGINYDRPIKVRLSLGGAEGTLATDDDDDNGYWSNGLPLSVDSNTDELRLSLQRAPGDDDQKQKLLLRGIYLTSDPHETVLASDRVVALNYPKVMDRSAPRPGNIIENGSFEAGFGHGWGSTDERRFSLASVWDPRTGKDGDASLRLPIDPSQSGLRPSEGAPVAIVSKPYSVAPNKRHTLSAWLKTEGGSPVTGEISLVNAFGAPAAPELEGRPGQHIVARKFRVGDQWTRVDLTGFLLRYPTAEYHVRIAADPAAGRHLWMDAVSLNEGGPAAYAAKSPLEIGIQRTEPSNLYFDDEPVRMRLRAYNAGRQSLQRTVRYEIYDYLNRRVRTGRRAVRVPPQSVATQDLAAGVGRRGVFRIVMWVDGQQGTQEEVVYGVVPRPRRGGADRASVVGTHSNFLDFQYAAMARLGIKWDRALSPGRFFRWSVVEPEDDKFLWYDAEIRRAQRRGVSVLGTLGTNKYWPEWAADDGLPDLDEWAEFVGQVVRHYRGSVQAWEIWNEPNYDFTAAFYARMLKRAAEAVKRADPGASVVAMGGPFDAQFIREVFGELRKQYPSWPWRQYIDTLSMHMYPARVEREAAAGGRAAAFRQRILPAYRVPLWNTESGEWDIGFYKTSNAVRTAWGESLYAFANTAELTASSPDAIRSVTTTFLETIGNGLGKFFYYDFRIGATPTYTKSSPTMLEYDDTVRPKAIAYAALAHLFERARGRGRIKLADARSQAFVFDRGGASLAGLYTIDDRLRTITLAGVPAERLAVYDAMGNRIPAGGGRVAFGPTPVYVEARGVPAAALERAFEQATIAQRRDSEAPSPSIDEAPRGRVDGASLRVRWSAADNGASPSLDRPGAITYSYRLVGKSGSDAWSAWTPRSTADFTNLAGGRYRLEVRARDAAGNESAVVSRPFEVA